MTILAAARQEKFTTKEIAAKVGVSEANLYRHFKNKAAILEGLAQFCDQAIMGMCQDIDARSGLDGVQRAVFKLHALLSFAEANPGLTRLLTGEALVYEDDAVAAHIRQVIAKVQLGMRQNLKDAAMAQQIAADSNIAMHVNIMMSFVEGRWKRFSQSGFRDKPTEGWSVVQTLFARVG